MGKPFYFKNIEHEANIHIWRVKRGLTTRQLCELAGIPQMQLSSLANGVRAPIHSKTGEVTPSAARVAKALNVPLEELFPRYVCRIPTAPYEWEVNDLTIGEYTRNRAQDHAGLYPEHALLEHLLSALTPREQLTLRLMFFDDLTLEEVAPKLGLISRERVRQIRNKALKKLRRINNHENHHIR